MNIKLVLVVLAAVLLLVIVLQNAEPVTVKLFFWSVTMSRVILLLLVGGLGFVAGFAVAKLTGGGAHRA